MNPIVLKKFKPPPGRAKCSSCQKIVPPKTKLCSDCTRYCAVCECRTVPTNTQVCKNCVQFFQTLKHNVTVVSCTQSPTCFQFSPTSYCPLHKYIKCQMYLEQTQPNGMKPDNSIMVSGKKIQARRRSSGTKPQDTFFETSMNGNDTGCVSQEETTSRVSR
uniref:Uncharacterized protein n=1 Tax=Cacopsylla melanoneura TaxID=428564 RepID=A0A8D8R3E6_9HEMI